MRHQVPLQLVQRVVLNLPDTLTRQTQALTQQQPGFRLHMMQAKSTFPPLVLALGQQPNPMVQQLIHLMRLQQGRRPLFGIGDRDVIKTLSVTRCTYNGAQ